MLRNTLTEITQSEFHRIEKYTIRLSWVLFIFIIPTVFVSVGDVRPNMPLVEQYSFYALIVMAIVALGILITEMLAHETINRHFKNKTVLFPISTQPKRVDRIINNRSFYILCNVLIVGVFLVVMFSDVARVVQMACVYGLLILLKMFSTINYFRMVQTISNRTKKNEHSR